MKGAIMLSGGGGTKLFAAIGVTYPAGAIVTCTKGTKTLAAKNTSGQWVFAIPEAGTWTVTAGSRSASVSITKEGQVEKVFLGDLPLVSANSGLLDGYSLTKHYISPAIDVTDFSTLTITGRQTAAPGTTDIWVGLAENPEAINNNSVKPACEVAFPFSSTEQTKSMDLSSMSGTYYLGFWAWGSHSQLPLSMSGNVLKADDGSVKGSFSSIKFE